MTPFRDVRGVLRWLVIASLLAAATSCEDHPAGISTEGASEDQERLSGRFQEALETIDEKAFQAEISVLSGNDEARAVLEYSASNAAELSAVLTESPPIGREGWNALGGGQGLSPPWTGVARTVVADGWVFVSDLRCPDQYVRWPFEESSALAVLDPQLGLIARTATSVTSEGNRYMFQLAPTALDEAVMAASGSATIEGSELVELTVSYESDEPASTYQTKWQFEYPDAVVVTAPPADKVVPRGSVGTQECARP